jgi:hypothetical protein
MFLFDLFPQAYLKVFELLFSPYGKQMAFTTIV